MEYRDTIIKILREGKISDVEAVLFIKSYIAANDQALTEEEFKIIYALCMQGRFSLQFAAEKAAELEGIQIHRMLDKNNYVVSTYFYDKDGKPIK